MSPQQLAISKAPKHERDSDVYGKAVCCPTSLHHAWVQQKSYATWFQISQGQKLTTGTQCTKRNTLHCQSQSNHPAGRSGVHGLYKLFTHA